MKIDTKTLGVGHPPFIIAEMSGNHNQSLERAMAIVEAAARSGAHALKLQTYTPDSMTLDLDEGDFHIEDPKSIWKGSSLYNLYQKAHTPYEWHEPLFQKCRELGIIPFSTPFDEGAVDFLEKLNVAVYKVASFESSDLPLIRKIGATGKPMIISTGMASLGELDETVSTAREAGCQDIILLKCTSTYPASPGNSNLRTIPHLRNMFNCEVGLSDHTLGIGVALASIALGATVIEKHFTLSRAEGGVDSAFSLEPAEMETLVFESGKAWEALGEIRYGPTKEEIPSLQFRRTLYVAEDMKAGEGFTSKNLRRVRPGKGLPPKFYELFLGKKVTRDVRKGTPVTWDLIA